MKLLIATHNPGKVREFRMLLEKLEIKLISPLDIGLELEVAETGATYAENATIKGRAYSTASGMLTLADDTGLEVDALNGQPGLHSARFVNAPGATDADRCRLLLERLKDHPRPWTARFRCVVALADPQGGVQLAEGSCAGEIAPEVRGEGGFGYDPVFLFPELGKTMAELGPARKNQVSHRARAVAAILPRIQELLSKS